MDEEILSFIKNYDYTEIQKIPGQINEINETNKAILQELQKGNVENEEFQTFIMEAEPILIEEPIEQVPGEEPTTVPEQPKEEVSETPTEEATETPEEIPAESTEEVPVEEEAIEEPVEEPIDYMPLIYEELQTQNELLVEMNNSQVDSNSLMHEGFFMITIAMVCVIGVKVFIEQVTKW